MVSEEKKQIKPLKPLAFCCYLGFLLEGNNIAGSSSELVMITC